MSRISNDELSMFYCSRESGLIKDFITKFELYPNICLCIIELQVKISLRSYIVSMFKLSEKDKHRFLAQMLWFVKKDNILSSKVTRI